MKVQFAHLRAQGIDFAVFAVDAVTHSRHDRQTILEQLVLSARRNRLKVDKAALAFTEGGRPTYFGAPDLVRYLARGWIPRWTHTMELDS